MSNINSVRNLQIFYFSKKNKGIKNLKKWQKESGLISAFIHTTVPDPGPKKNGPPKKRTGSKIRTSMC